VFKYKDETKKDKKKKIKKILAYAIDRERERLKKDKDILLERRKDEALEFIRNIMLNNYDLHHDLHVADFEKWFDEKAGGTNGIMYLTSDGDFLDLFEKCIRKR